MTGRNGVERRGRVDPRLIAWLSLALCAAPAAALPGRCPLQGDAKRRLAKELNRYKNREDAPPAASIHWAATLRTLLAPGPDLRRWSRQNGAVVEGLVVHVKVGGIESGNCHARNAGQRETHIELAFAVRAPARARLIVEVTPRWREKMRPIADWSTAALKKRLVGHRVRITGWLFDDLEHVREAENSNPGGGRNWRATIWEIHPITGIERLPALRSAATAAAMSPQRLSSTQKPPRRAARRLASPPCASAKRRGKG